MIESWECPECGSEIIERKRRGPHLSACRRSRHANGEPVAWAAETGIIRPTEKFCNDCNTTKPYSLPFWYNDQSVCIECFQAASKRRYAEDEAFRLSAIERSRYRYLNNTEMIKEQRLQNYQDHAQERRDHSRQYNFGISPEQYACMLQSQNYGCAICGETEPSGRALAIDHDHRCCPGKKSCGKCVRGLLCTACNQALGKLKDSPELIRKAADYLDAYLPQENKVVT